jgi:hypothetical protein
MPSKKNSTNDSQLSSAGEQPSGKRKPQNGSVRTPRKRTTKGPQESVRTETAAAIPASGSSVPGRFGSAATTVAANHNPRKTRKPRSEGAGAASEGPAAIQQVAGVSDRERIALLAYSFWEARGRQGGSPEDDWYRAEREILGRV